MEYDEIEIRLMWNGFICADGRNKEIKMLRLTKSSQNGRLGT